MPTGNDTGHQAGPGVPRTVNAIVLEGSATICKEILNAVHAAGFVVKAVQAEDIEQLRERLATGTGALLIVSYTASDERLEQLGRLLAAEGRGIDWMLAMYDIDAAGYARALRGGTRDVLVLHDPECIRLAIGRGLDGIDARHGGRGAASSAVSAPPSGKVHGPLRSGLWLATGSHDLLTGLFSHHYLFEAFDTVTARRPESGRLNALLYIKLDRFDELQAHLGEAGSDLVLGELANLIRQSITADDIPFRIRDETFAILVRNRPQKAIVQVARDLLRRVQETYFDVLGRVIKGTCSVGVSLFGQGNDNLEEIISKASIACEVAQSESGGQFHVYDQATDAGLRSAMVSDHEDRLRTALHHDRFAAVFQPIVNLRADPGENYEVLLRMIDDLGREMLPGEFISAANHAKLMPEIDRWVVNHGIRKLSERQEVHGGIRFFIKVDRQTLDDDTFLPWLARRLEEGGIPGERLTFQVSEPAVAKRVEQLQDALSGLHRLHCLCALEHAGRTAEALSLIRAMPFDYVKIDGALTHDLAGNDLHQARVKSIIENAKSKGKQVIVPFVEDAKSLSLLWRWGTDYVQGHYVQRPNAHLNYAFGEQP